MYFSVFEQFVLHPWNHCLLIYVFLTAYQYSLWNPLPVLFYCNLYFLVVSLASRYSGRYYTYSVFPGFIQYSIFQSQEYISLYYRSQSVFEPEPKPTYIHSCYKYENLRPYTCNGFCTRLHIHWVRNLLGS